MTYKCSWSNLMKTCPITLPNSQEYFPALCLLRMLITTNLSSGITTTMGAIGWCVQMNESLHPSCTPFSSLPAFFRNDGCMTACAIYTIALALRTYQSSSLNICMTEKTYYTTCRKINSSYHGADTQSMRMYNQHRPDLSR